MKFVRRRDLSAATRARIALEACLHRGVWGTVTRLAKQYRVSRQFIYLLVWSVSHVFEAETSAAPSPAAHTVQVPWDELVLALKLQGACSEGDISQILKTLGVARNSIGSISQQLHRLAAALPKEHPQVCRVIVVLADEIFASRRPILVVMEARSHYILKAFLAPDRRGQTWHALFEELKTQGHAIDYVVKDPGARLWHGAEEAGLGHRPDLMQPSPLFKSSKISLFPFSFQAMVNRPRLFLIKPSFCNWMRFFFTLSGSIPSLPTISLWEIHGFMVKALSIIPRICLLEPSNGLCF